jgi:hypothetical protein
MKTKTIAKILATRFDAFAESITDTRVRDLVKKGTIITGGCIVSLLSRENVHDFDMYFKDEETAFAVAEYYAGVFHAKNPSYDVKAVRSGGRVTISVRGSKNHSVAGAVTDDTEPGVKPEEDSDISPEADEAQGDKKVGRYQPIFLSSNAITLSTKVQLIIRFFGEPDQIHENYDFVHCTNYWTSWDRKVVLRPAALEAIITKELRYVGSRYPLCSLIRTRKFISRGWTINAGQYVKMAWQVSKLDLEDIEVLKDQLVGVDSAYFADFIYKLTCAADEGRAIDGALVTELIDSIF